MTPNLREKVVICEQIPLGWAAVLGAERRVRDKRRKGQGVVQGSGRVERSGKHGRVVGRPLKFMVMTPGMHQELEVPEAQSREQNQPRQEARWGAAQRGRTVMRSHKGTGEQSHVGGCTELKRSET